MRRLLAIMLMGVGLSVALADPPTRVLTFPQTPPAPALDRLNLDLGWRVKLPVESRRDGIATILNTGKYILVRLRNGTLYALDAETGLLQWSNRVGNPYPVVADIGTGDDLALITDGTRVVALELATGIQRWDLNLPATPSAAPTADDAFVYVPMSNRQVATYAMPVPTVAPTAPRIKTTGTAKMIADDKAAEAAKARMAPKTIEKKATTTAQDPRSAGRTSASTNRTTTASTNEARTTTAHEMGTRSTTSSGEGQSNTMTFQIRGAAKAPTAEELAAMAARPKLIRNTSAGFPIDHSPLIGRVAVIVSGSDREVIALRKHFGDEQFRFTLESPLAAAPERLGDWLYVATRDSVVYGVEVVSGRIAWRYTTSSPVSESPIATDNDLFLVTERNGMVRLDRMTGLETWNNPNATKFLAVNDKFVYANDRIGQLLVLNRLSGAELSHYDASAFNVTVVNDMTDRLLLAAHDGTILSLHDRNQVAPLNLRTAVTTPLPKKTDRPVPPLGDPPPEVVPEKPINRPTPKPPAPSTETPAEKPPEPPPAEKPDDKPAEKPDDKPAEKPPAVR